MTLVWPWLLAGLAAVAAAAVVAIRRPLQQVVRVSSLRLWRLTLAAMGGRSQRTRRMSLAWWLLLAGSAVAVLAVARPVAHRSAPARTVALAIYPGYELASTPAAARWQAVRDLLGRLGRADRVYLLLPTLLGGQVGPVSPADAETKVNDLPVLPVPAAELTVTEPPRECQSLYQFAPPSLTLPTGPEAWRVAMSVTPPPVGLEAFAAEPVNATTTAPASGVSVFLAVRNNSAAVQQGRVEVKPADVPATVIDYRLAPGARQGFSLTLPEAAYYVARIDGATGPSASAYLARQTHRRPSIAMIGRDDPMVRRALEAAGVRLVADAASADAVVAIAAQPLAGKSNGPVGPALLIDPPAPPPSAGAGHGLQNLALRDANIASNDPLLEGVDLSNVAVRQATAWPIAGTGLEGLVTVGTDAVLAVDRPGRRVYLGFNLAPENTNFTLDQSFVVLMGNVLEFLAAPLAPVTNFQAVTPSEAGTHTPWRRVTGQDQDGGSTANSPPSPGAPGLPWPGIYRDADGKLHAVSLTIQPPSAPTSQPATISPADAPLPQPQPARSPLELWPILLAAAGGLWLAGWVARLTN
jgi:hypothetical protein